MDYPGHDLEAMFFARRYGEWILDTFKDHLHGRMAEVGAGSGNMTELFLGGSDCRMDCFEPSPEMYAQLATRFADDDRVTATCGTFTEHASDSPYDTIVYINVLEHIEDDGAEVRFCAERLNPGGVLGLFVPAHPFLYSPYDRSIGHFRRYRKRRLKRVVEEAGLHILQLRHMDWLGVLPWYLSMVLLKGQLSPGKVAAYDRVGVPVTRFIERWIRPPFGKNLMLIARKEAGAGS